MSPAGLFCVPMYAWDQWGSVVTVRPSGAQWGSVVTVVTVGISCELRDQDKNDELPLTDP